MLPAGSAPRAMWPASSESAPDDVAKSLLFRWRERLLSDAGPPRTRRYVLLVLSTYGDQRGADIFPSTKELARATGMSRRRVEGHLREAESEHWIRRASVGKGQGWRRMRYELVMPKVGTERPHDDPERGDGASQPLRRDVGTKRPNLPPQRGDVEDERGDDSDVNVGTERPTTSVVPLHSTSPTTSPAREDDEDLERELKENEPQAKLNIIVIHGGTEDDVEIKGHQVGMGIDINRYRRRCRAGGDPPEIIAAAIAYLPIVTGLAPPLSLAPWDRNPAIYEQCIGRAYHDQEATPTNDVTIKTVPSPTSSGDVVGVEKQRAEQRKQLEQLRREASP